MKILTIFSAVILLSLYTIAQDKTPKDPLAGPFGEYPVFANSVEILFLTDSVRGLYNQVPSIRIIDLADGELVESQPYTTSSVGLVNGLWTECITGDFDGDGKDEILTGWVSTDGIFRMEMSDAVRLKPTYAWEWNSRMVVTSSWTNGAIRMLAANLDSTARKEIIVCTHDGSFINVVAYFMDDGLNLTPGAVYRMYSGTEFDLTTGDFNGDGIDELVHVFHSVTNLDHSLLLQKYIFNPVNRSFVSKGGWGKITTAAAWDNWKRLKVTTGDFRNLGRDEIVISLTLVSGNSGRQVFNYIPVSASGDFTYPSPPGQYPSGSTLAYGWESDAVAADLNPEKKDGDELIVAGPGEVAVIKFNSSLAPYYVGNARTPFLFPGALEEFPRRHFVAIADMDPDTSTKKWASEIIVAEHKQDSTTVFRVLSTNINTNHDITGLTEKAVYASSHKSRKSEIAVGDFDGDAIRIGTPTLIKLASVIQPIVELNVPPTHFDYLNGQVYDICKVHGAAQSQFEVTYTETQSQSSHFSSELTQGWGVSGEISGGVNYFGTKVEGYVQSAYDQGYYGSHSENTTITASQVTSSTGDDWILATVTDYDLWEYPLYAMGTRFSNILVQIPHFRGTEWFPRKNVIARNWVANHEVGNLFSYLRKDDIPEWTGAHLLTKFTGKYISTASYGAWMLDLASQTIDANSLSKSIGVEVGASVSGWGMEAKVAGSYSREEISTHISTATKNVTIEVKVSETDKSFGDTDYLVTPYIYWGENGAMVIDYAVDLSSLGDPLYGTFWDKNYLAYPDPGFILPWRLDTFKGIYGTGSLKLYNKSLRVSPIAPEVGDTVLITANVHNFSLKNTVDPVTVKFYLGDPANGGTPITGIDGTVGINTGVPVRAQNRETVKMYWVVPSGLNNQATVYAVIDPDNTIIEIHEDNNIGFVPLRVQGLTDVEDETTHLIPEQYSLKQNYPNPFNPVTTLQYSVPQSSNVRLKIFDILGKDIIILVDEEKPAGTYEITWSAGNLPSGVYFCIFQAGNFVETKKMILIK
jgi:hypothetical protein